MRTCTKAAALLAMVTTVAVTTVAGAPAGAATGAATSGRKTITVKVEKGTVRTADSLRPGLVRLHNTSGSDVGIYGRRKADQHQLARDLTAANSDSGGPGRLLKDFTVIDVIPAHRDAFVPLGKGTYYLDNEDADTYKAAQIHTLVVSGSSVDARKPAHPAWVTVSRSRALQGASVLPRSGWVHVVNRASILHSVGVFGVAASATDSDVKSFLNAPTFEKLFRLTSGDGGEFAVLAAGRSAYAQFSGRPGRYVEIELGFIAGADMPTLHRSGVRLAVVK